MHKPQAPVGIPFDDVAVTIRRAAMSGTASPRPGRRPGAGPVAWSSRSAATSATGWRPAGRRCDALSTPPGLELSSRVSPVYETDPVGGPEQPDYLNAVLLADTALPAAAAAATACHAVEAARPGPRGALGPAHAGRGHHRLR